MRSSNGSDVGCRILTRKGADAVALTVLASSEALTKDLQNNNRTRQSLLKSRGSMADFNL